MADNDRLQNDPAFAGISPVKLLFLEKILDEMKKQNKETMMPFFLAVNAKAAQAGISFTDQETELIFSQMESRLSPEEKKRFSLIREMMKQKG